MYFATSGAMYLVSFQASRGLCCGLPCGLWTNGNIFCLRTIVLNLHLIISEYPYVHTRMTHLLPEWSFPHCFLFCFMEIGAI